MLTVIKPFCKEFKRESRMDQILSKVLHGRDVDYILTAEELEKRDLRGRKLLFAVCLSEAGREGEAQTEPCAHALLYALPCRLTGRDRKDHIHTIYMGAESEVRQGLQAGEAEGGHRTRERFHT